MKRLANKLRGVVDRAEAGLKELPGTWTSVVFMSPVGVRPAPGKWSPIEILGHLVDSAVNNQFRFMKARFTHELVFPGYDQEAWVEEQRYREREWDEVLAEFVAMNRHIVRIIETTPSDVAGRTRVQHNLHQIAWRTVPEGEATTLAYFMGDYIEHLLHHLRQLLGPAFK